MNLRSDLCSHSVKEGKKKKTFIALNRTNKQVYGCMILPWHPFIRHQTKRSAQSLFVQSEGLPLHLKTFGTDKWLATNKKK